MWVARSLLLFLFLLHRIFWCHFPLGFGQYRLGSASLHYFPHLALQYVSKHSDQSDSSNGRCVDTYHIVAYHHSSIQARIHRTAGGGVYTCADTKGDIELAKRALLEEKQES